MPYSDFSDNANEEPVRNTTIDPSKALASERMRAVIETSGFEESGETLETGDVTRPAFVSEEEEDQTVGEDDASFNVVHHSDSSDNAYEEPGRSTTIAPSEALKSEDMRAVIETFGFKESGETFQTGGVERSVFFYKEEEDCNLTKRTYIALAHDEEPDASNVQLSGERSIQTVLQTITTHLQHRDNEGTTNILIPLQQISKGHWTLLAITSKPSGKPESNKLSVTATHYDSKGQFSLSHIIDIMTPQGLERIKNAVKEYFSTKTVKCKYVGTQGLLDHHNCGRYVLIKLRGLLDPGATKLSIDDINRSLYRGEEQTNTQEETSGRKNKKQLMKGLLGLTSRMPNSQGSESDTLPGESSASDGWEMMGEE